MMEPLMVTGRIGRENQKGVALSRIASDPVVRNMEAARAALSKATEAGQVKHILDVAASAEIYARRQQLGDEAIGVAFTMWYPLGSVERRQLDRAIAARRTALTSGSEPGGRRGRPRRADAAATPLPAPGIERAKVAEP